MAEASLTILPAILLGLAIGIYEAILIHRDVSVPTHRFGHTIHALIFAIIAVFINMNVSLVLGWLPFLAKIPIVGTVLGIRIIVGLIMMIKIHGVSAALKGAGMSSAGMGETWAHSFVVAALTVAAPYAWPFLAPVFPAWLR